MIILMQIIVQYQKLHQGFKPVHDSHSHFIECQLHDKEAPLRILTCHPAHYKDVRVIEYIGSKLQEHSKDINTKALDIEKLDTKDTALCSCGVLCTSGIDNTVATINRNVLTLWMNPVPTNRSTKTRQPFAAFCSVTCLQSFLRKLKSESSYDKCVSTALKSEKGLYLMSAKCPKKAKSSKNDSGK